MGFDSASNFANDAFYCFEELGEYFESCGKLLLVGQRWKLDLQHWLLHRWNSMRLPSQVVSGRHLAHVLQISHH
jgi:hypothetical protein